MIIGDDAVVNKLAADLDMKVPHRKLMPQILPKCIGAIAGRETPPNK